MSPKWTAPIIIARMGWMTIPHVPSFDHGPRTLFTYVYIYTYIHIWCIYDVYSYVRELTCISLYVLTILNHTVYQLLTSPLPFQALLPPLSHTRILRVMIFPFTQAMMLMLLMFQKEITYLWTIYIYIHIYIYTYIYIYIYIYIHTFTYTYIYITYTYTYTYTYTCIYIYIYIHTYN